MKKGLFLVSACVLAFAFACNKTESAATTTTADGAAAAPTTTQQSATSAIVDKALSFIGAGPFEGEITMSVSDAAKPEPKAITYDVKGTKMRFVAPEEHGPMSGGYVIFDTVGKKMTVVQDAKKTAMVMDMGAMGAGLTPGTPPPGPKPTIDKTGKNDVVAGYTCEQWKITDVGGERTDVCVAQGITFPVMGRRAGTGWMSQLEGSFPLRAITYDSTGKEKSRMEVTKIEKKSLDDAMFQVPAGYTTQDMGEMMKNLGGLRGGFRPPR